jgi:hypothetical protein
MATERHEGQKLLLVISSNESIGVKIIGATIESPMEPLNDLEFSEDGWLPDIEPGVYVWEGTITITEAFQKYEGTMRLADELDIPRFGLRSLAPVTLGQTLDFWEEREKAKAKAKAKEAPHG